ncbi:MAG: hypothetical protein ACOX45_08150 [Acutalibacteraceae bacterium]
MNILTKKNGLALVAVMVLLNDFDAAGACYADICGHCDLNSR